MICFECNNRFETGDRYKTYQYRGLEIYVHTIGCEGVLIDKAHQDEKDEMERFNAELDAIEKQCLNETREETRAYLRAAGYDPDALAKRLRKKIRKMLDESPLNPKNKGPQS